MGGKDRTGGKPACGGGRAAAAASAAADAAAAARQEIRDRCKEAVQLMHGGDLDGAFVIATDLSARHTSAAIYNLVALLHEAIADKASDAFCDFNYRTVMKLPENDPDVIAFKEDLAVSRATNLANRATAAEIYSKAMLTAPNCPLTRACWGRAIARCGRMAEGHKVILSAVRMLKPDSPDAAHPWIAPQDSRDLLKTQLAMFLAEWEPEVCDSCTSLIEWFEAGDSVMAMSKATELSRSYPFSARARLIGPYIQYAIIQTSPFTNDAAVYKNIVKETITIADEFDSSLTVALFKVEVMLAAGRRTDAAKECMRALAIKDPDDPFSQDIPPGSSSSNGRRTERIKWVKDKLSGLLEQIKDDLAQEDKVANQLKQLAIDESAKSEGKATQVSVGEASKLQKKANLQTQKKPHVEPKVFMRSSLMYTTKRRTNTIIAQPLPEQLVGDRVIPVGLVDAYADFCRFRSTCPIRREVCHICVIEKGEIYPGRYTQLRKDMFYHVSFEHRKGSTVKCEVEGCDVLLCTEDDIFLHHHYVHERPAGWWRGWRPVT